MKNIVTMRGYVVGEPSQKDVSGYTVINFSISVRARFKKDKDDSNKKHVSFFECEYWPNQKITGNVQKEIAKVEKGNLLIFDAELIQERWEQDGNKRSKVKLLVDGFLDKCHHVNSKSGQSAPADQPPDDLEDDIPF